MTRVLLIAWLGLAFAAMGEPPPSPAVKRKSLTVLIGSDTSGFNLATALQYAVGQLFKTSEAYEVQVSSYGLTAFTPDETKKAHQTVGSEAISFVYMDKERISLFVFDIAYPGQFIVAVNALLDQGETQLTTPLLEGKLRKTFGDALALYDQRKFQYLPGAGGDKSGEPVAETETDIARRKAAEAGHLFRELATLSERPLYLGANLGMARYGADGRSNSVVNVGAFAGFRVATRMSVEMALDIFTYGLLTLDGRYQLPIAGKYVYLDASFGVGAVLFQSSTNLGYEAATLPSGIFFGPGIHFTVPLLGANIRGGIKFLIGSGSILLGNYGVSYAVSL